MKRTTSARLSGCDFTNAWRVRSSADYNVSK